jgi:hypothetical protein
MMTKQRAAEQMQTVETDVLAAAASGELDLNAVARQELANRGLDWNGKWIGFQKAASSAKLYPVRGANGKMIAVSIPE